MNEQSILAVKSSESAPFSILNMKQVGRGSLQKKQGESAFFDSKSLLVPGLMDQIKYKYHRERQPEPSTFGTRTNTDATPLCSHSMCSSLLIKFHRTVFNLSWWAPLPVLPGPWIQMCSFLVW
jgi:hypothetical protein